MADVTLQTIHKELVHIRSDIEFLKNAIKEDYELSDWAKKELAESRKVPDSELISHENAKRLILGR
ncbi:hypothetical protein J4206_02150 [Candidatus Woesearchaeota archaeon]|nr:hypothetical protein [Candidatus Woesearchaeota archaeon]